jgi:hypothetical protein
MTCQFSLNKAIRNSFLVCILLGGVASNDACAAEAIESTFLKARTMLAKKSPSQLAKFKAFEERMYNLLRSFLDKNNKEAYAVHIGHMEENLKHLELEFVSHKDFGCIKNLTHAFHQELVKLLALLKNHATTKNPTLLGLALVRFEHLLPKVIMAEVGGTRGLLDRLSYRLSC